MLQHVASWRDGDVGVKDAMSDAVTVNALNVTESDRASAKNETRKSLQPQHCQHTNTRLYHHNKAESTPSNNDVGHDVLSRAQIARPGRACARKQTCPIDRPPRPTTKAKVHYGCFVDTQSCPQQRPYISQSSPLAATKVRARDSTVTGGPGSAQRWPAEHAWDIFLIFSHPCQ